MQNDASQQQRWDELDQKFWAIYQTLDEGKMHRNYRLFARGSIVIAGLDVFCVVFLLFTNSSSFIAWIFAFFMFSCVFFLLKQMRRQKAVWAPEKQP